MQTEVIKIIPSTWISESLLTKPAAKGHLGNQAAMEEGKQCFHG